MLGVIQGFITTFLLFRLQLNKNANKLLAWIIFLISLACLNLYFLETLENTPEIFKIFEAIVPLVIIMPIGPLTYFYVKKILNPSFTFEASNRKHFYPVLLDFFPNFLTIFFVIGGFLGVISLNQLSSLGSFIETYNQYVDIPRWLSLFMYAIFTFRMILNHKTDNSNLVFKKWAKQFTLGFIIFSIIWFFHLVPYLIPSLSNSLLKIVGWYPIYIPLIVLVYWLGINGYIISFKANKKISKSSIISDNDVQATLKSLKKIMEEDKQYLNPSLKLKDVVVQTKIPQKTISTVLNQHLQTSFNDYVNGYRVEEFKERLLSDNSENFTILGIAFECGFNSQATFQRVFKASTNYSPSEFKKLHLKI